MGTGDIYNFRRADERFLTGGQTSEAQLRAAAAEGVKAVINLAPYNPEYSLDDEAGLVASLGMAYTHIPVEWTDPKEADFAAFEQAMDELPAGPALVHCVANFRATAYFSLYAQKRLGWTAERAEALRAPIWQGSDYPVWERFIRGMEAGLST